MLSYPIYANTISETASSFYSDTAPSIIWPNCPNPSTLAFVLYLITFIVYYIIILYIMMLLYCFILYHIILYHITIFYCIELIHTNTLWAQIGHVNIGSIFLFLGNSQWGFHSTQSILSQEYRKLIGLYWKVMRTQLWTFTTLLVSIYH